MQAHEREAFARDGYVVLADVVRGQLLDQVTREVGRLATSTGSAGPRLRSINLVPDEAPAAFSALRQSGLSEILDSLVSPGHLELVSDDAQFVVNVPPTMVDPSMPHIDYHVPGAERPNSFTALVAILLSDQQGGEEGNVWVWPGTHHLYAEYLAAYGPCSLLEHGGSISRAVHVTLPRPTPVCGKAGDVFVAHPLLGHATGPNISDRERKAVYFRLRRTDHLERWEACLTDPLLEYDVAPRRASAGGRSNKNVS